MYQSLQRVLSSLEAAAAAWRRPGSQEAEGAAAAEGPFEGQEGAAGWPPEAARLAERNAWLRLAVQSREDELGRMRASLRAMEAEKEVLLREVGTVGLGVHLGSEHGTDDPKSSKEHCRSRRVMVKFKRPKRDPPSFI